MENILIQGLSKFNDLKSGYLERKEEDEGPKESYLMIPKSKKKEEEKKAAELKSKKKGKQKETKKKSSDDEDEESEDGIINYQYNISKRNEVSATKLFNDTPSMLNYLIGKDGFFFTSENFQWKFMRDAPKLMWKSERMEDIGDFVLLFPNPDQVTPSEIPAEAENGIDFETAKEYFAQILETQYNYPNKRKFFKSLKEAFKLAFMELDEFKPLDPKQKEKLKKAEDAKAAEDAKKKGKGKSDQKYQDANNPGAGSEPLVTEGNGMKPGENKKHDKDKKATVEKKETQGLDKSVVPGASQNPDAKGDPSDQTKAKETDKKDEEANLQKELTKKRRVWAGQFYVPPKPQKDADGKTQDPPRHAQWKRHAEAAGDGAKARDFLTIMRRCIVAVLANQGFLMREVFVDKGKWIALVLTMPEENLKSFAREIGLQKPVEFACSDLMSLEPIDSKNRPLRINGYLLDEKLWEQEYLTDDLDPEKKTTVVELRRSIVNLLEDDCDFKSIVRMCGGVWHSHKEEESPPNVFQHAVVDLKEWFAYRSYLVELSFHMHEIRLLNQKMNYILKSYYNRDRLSFHGNQNRKQVDAIEIFKITTSLVVNAFKTAIKKEFRPDDANSVKLRNMWDELGCAPREHLFSYEPPNNNMRPRLREHYERIWVEELHMYQPTEQKQGTDKGEAKQDPSSHTSPFEKIEQCLKNYQPVNLQEVLAAKSLINIFYSKFSKVERLKTTNVVINKVLNVSRLKDFFVHMWGKKSFSTLTNLVDDSLRILRAKEIFFPIHEKPILEGEGYGETFNNLWELKHYFENVVQEHKPVTVQYKGDLNKLFPKGASEQDAIYHKAKKPESQQGKSMMNVALDKSADISGFVVNGGKNLASGGGTFFNRKLSLPGLSNDSPAPSPRGRSEQQNQQSFIRNEVIEHDDPNSQVPPEFDFEVRNLPRLAVPFEQPPVPRSNISPAVTPRGELSKSRRSKQRHFSVGVSGMAKSELYSEHMNMNLLKIRLGSKHSYTTGKVKAASQLPKSSRAKVIKFEDSNIVALVESRKRVRAGIAIIASNYYSGISTPILKVIYNARGLNMISMSKSNPASPRKLFTSTVFLPDLTEWQESFDEIKDLYAVDNLKLVDAMLQAFITTADVRSTVIPLLPKLGVDVFKSLSQQKRDSEEAGGFKGSLMLDSAPKIYKEDGLPESSIVHYFGENYGLFFAFLNLFQKNTWLISLEFFAIFIYIVYYYFLVDLTISAGASDEEYDNHIAKFTGYHYVFWIVLGYIMLRATTWACSLYLDWEDFESQFRAKTGLSGAPDSDSEEPKHQRFKFIGRLARSITLDMMNDTEEESGHQRKATLVILLVNSVMVLASVVGGFYLLYAKRYCTKRAIITQLVQGQMTQKNIDNSFNFADQTLFNILEIVRCRLFNIGYFAVITKLAVWRNYRYREDHENFLVLCRVIFELVNLGFVPMIMYYQALVTISIINSKDGSWERLYQENFICVQYNCPVEITFLMVVNTMANLLYYLLWQALMPPLVTKLSKCWESIRHKKPKAGKTGVPNPALLFRLFTSVKDSKPLDTAAILPSYACGQVDRHYMELEPDELAAFIKKHELPATQFRNETLKKLKIELLENEGAYYDGINREIDSQCSFKKDSETGGDFDENFKNYLRVERSFIETMMFACPAPAQFLALWASSNVNFFNRARDLILKLKRPIPWTVNNIGLWKELLLVTIYLSAFMNSVYFGFVALQFRNTPAKFIAFAGFLLVSMNLIYYKLDTSEESNDDSGEVLGARQKFLKKTLFPKLSEVRGKIASKLLNSFKDQKVQLEYKQTVQVGIWELAQGIDEEIETTKKEEAEKEVYKKIVAKNTADFHAQTAREAVSSV